MKPLPPLQVAGLAILAALAACATAPPRADAPPPSPAPAPAPAPTPAPAPDDARFSRWVSDFRAVARAAGLTDATLQAAFADVHYRPDVVEHDRAQPELTRAVWDYLDAAVSPARLARGAEQLARLQAPADAAARRYGVPAAVLVAIWGIESDYGRFTGDIPTIDALATLAFDGRRAAWARDELIAALRILQNGDIDRTRMVGSWAGAMGQTQLLPSKFLADAVDADGDGRRDIWDDPADVLASTANFLAQSGWRADEPWGVEVRLPENFDAARADAAVRQPASGWAAEGVRAADGSALPPLADASVLLPAGVGGPAFLAGQNFRAILRYNNSTSYALAVGLLAQQLAGGPGVQAAWPRALAVLSRSQLQALQAGLDRLGFDCGPPDGVMGPATREALRRYQRSVGLPADGFPTLQILQRVAPP